MSVTPEPAAPAPAPKKSHFLRNLFILCLAMVVIYLYTLPESGEAAPEKPPVSALTSQSFAGAVASGVHMVDFWAEWCGPCKTQDPIVTDVARRFAGKVAVSKVDIDSEMALARQFEITGIPTIIIFKNGREAGRFVGVTPTERLTEALGKLL